MAINLNKKVNKEPLLSLWDEAYQLVSQRRRRAHFNSDIWSVRAQWKPCTKTLFNCVMTMTYLMSPMLASGKNTLLMWGAKDAIALCALSPLIGASILWHIDDHFEQKCSPRFYYTRYMDDFLILSEQRWSVKRSIAWLYTQIHYEGYSLHPDKTTTGRLDQGFDWLGVWFSPHGKCIAPRAVENHRLKKEEKENICRKRRYS